jgi:hypothetical protein
MASTDTSAAAAAVAAATETKGADAAPTGSEERPPLLLQKSASELAILMYKDSIETKLNELAYVARRRLDPPFFFNSHSERALL